MSKNEPPNWRLIHERLTVSLNDFSKSFEHFYSIPELVNPTLPIVNRFAELFEPAMSSIREIAIGSTVHPQQMHEMVFAQNAALQQAIKNLGLSSMQISDNLGKALAIFGSSLNTFEFPTHLHAVSDILSEFESIEEIASDDIIDIPETVTLTIFNKKVRVKTEWIVVIIINLLFLLPQTAIDYVKDSIADKKAGTQAEVYQNELENQTALLTQILDALIEVDEEQASVLQDLKLSVDTLQESVHTIGESLDGSLESNDNMK